MFNRKNLIYLSKWELIDLVNEILSELLQEDIYQKYLKILDKKQIQEILEQFGVEDKDIKKLLK